MLKEVNKEVKRAVVQDTHKELETKDVKSKIHDGERNRAMKDLRSMRQIKDKNGGVPIDHDVVEGAPQRTP